MWETLTQVAQTLLKADPFYALLAVALYFISILILGCRWNTILKGMGCSVGLKESCLGILVSLFVNNVTPSSRIGGEISRIGMIGYRRKISFKQATLSVFYDRLTDIIPILLLVFLSAPTLFLLVKDLEGYCLGVIIFVLFIVGLVCVYKKSQKIQETLSRWRKNLAIVQIGWQKMALAVGLSGLVWLQDLARLTVVAAAFGVSLSPSQVATLSILTLMGGFLPTIGGLGAIEGGMTGALYLFGFNVETALAITALERAISYVISTLVGGLTLVAVGGTKIWRVIKSPVSVTGTSPKSEGSKSI